jgi:hypothetical protein
MALRAPTNKSNHHYEMVVAEETLPKTEEDPLQQNSITIVSTNRTKIRRT